MQASTSIEANGLGPVRLALKNPPSAPTVALPNRGPLMGAGRGYDERSSPGPAGTLAEGPALLQT